MFDFLFGRCKPKSRRLRSKAPLRVRYRKPRASMKVAKITGANGIATYDCSDYGTGYTAIPGQYLDDPWQCRAPNRSKTCPVGMWLDPWGSGRCVSRCTYEKRRMFNCAGQKNDNIVYDPTAATWDMSEAGPGNITPTPTTDLTSADFGRCRRRKPPCRRRRVMRKFQNLESPCYMPCLDRDGCEAKPGCVYVRGGGCRKGPRYDCMNSAVMPTADMSSADPCAGKSGQELIDCMGKFTPGMVAGFGKRRRIRRTTKSKKMSKSKKIPKNILRMCKKYHIKTTVKRGKKRVSKTLKVLKRLIAKKKKMLKKSRKHHKTVHRRRRRS